MSLPVFSLNVGLRVCLRVGIALPLWIFRLSVSDAHLGVHPHPSVRLL